MAVLQTSVERPADKLSRCESCGASWRGRSCSSCPACGHKYVRWLNFQAWVDAARAAGYPRTSGS